MNTNDTTLPSPDWKAIKRAYYGGEGSLRDLALRFGVPRRSMERRSSKEGWRQEVARLGGVVTAAAADAAIEEGKVLGMTAAAFNARQIGVALKLLARVDELAERETITGGELRQIAGAAKDADALGRLSLGMSTGDGEVARCAVNLHFVLRGPGSVTRIEAATDPTVEV